jgi:hypothetical protein
MDISEGEHPHRVPPEATGKKILFVGKGSPIDFVKGSKVSS